MQVLLQKLAGRHLTPCRLVRLRIGHFILAMGNFSKNKTLVGTLYPLMLAVLIGSTPAQEQTRVDEAFPCKDIEKLPSVKALIDSTTFYYNKFNFSKSAEFLHKILAEEKAGMYRLDGLCRAAIYQQLARCYDDSATLHLAQNYVIQSLREDPEIWREHAHPLLSERLQRMYRKCWSEILVGFNKKRRSLRFALGPISRVDFSYRLIDNWHIVGGVGTSTRLVLQKEVFDNFKPADNSLLFVRIQWMRKNIERLAAGFFGEFTLPIKDTRKSARVLSGGPIISYAYQSNWEIGSTFTVAQVEIGKNAANNLSQTAFKNEEVVVTYGIFEIYLRKWF